MNQLRKLLLSANPADLEGDYCRPAVRRRNGGVGGASPTEGPMLVQARVGGLPPAMALFARLTDAPSLRLVSAPIWINCRSKMQGCSWSAYDCLRVRRFLATKAK